MKQSKQNPSTTIKSALNTRSLNHKQSNQNSIFSENDISKFITSQISDEADYERHSLDFSKGQILYDKGDKKIGSNTVSNGIVSMKPHGSSYFSRISQKNFTPDSKTGYLAIKDHVVTVIENSVYDGLANKDNFYSKSIHEIATKSKLGLENSYELNLKSNYKKNSWNEITLSSGKTRVFGVETVFEKLDPENFTVKAFIQNGKFGHQNNCALITNFLLVLKSAFKSEDSVDETLKLLIKKTSGKEPKITTTNQDNMLIHETDPRLDVRSVRAFLATFLSVKAIYENKGIDITKNQDLYTNIVENIASNFKPLPKEIKDDVNDKLFWNIYQKQQLKNILDIGSNKEKISYGR